MGTAPKKPSSLTGTGKGKSGTSPPQVQFTEMLAREGAPWRPFDDKGILVKPLKTPRDANAIFAACEKQLVSHLKAVCLWPEKDRHQSLAGRGLLVLHHRVHPEATDDRLRAVLVAAGR